MRRIPEVLVGLLTHEKRDARERDKAKRKQLDKQKARLEFERRETVDRLKESGVPILVKRT